MQVSYSQFNKKLLVFLMNMNLRENIRIIRKVFVSVQAMDHAIDLTNKFQIK